MRLKRSQWKYTALAFALPMLGLLVLRLICTLTFDGVYSMLYSDTYHQYYPFFLAFRRALLSGDSLLYSWNVGMGMDYLGLISYYLASPLNLLSVLFPESWMLGYFSFLTPLKISFASLFFAVFLKKLYGQEDFSISLFGTFYGFCAWALGYQWNIMWLDTFALLPLVMLGMVRLLQERKFVLYTLMLFLSISANYYIGFFVCIFVLLTFFCYEACCCKSLRRFWIDVLCMAVFSLIAIGMTTFLSLPTLAALQTTQSSVNTFPKEIRLNIAKETSWIGLLDAMRQVAGNMNGALEPTLKEGLPNLHCGVIANVFALLFLFCKEVSWREKICSVLLLLFFNISFIVRQLDFIWHGFHFTNMIPYRFSFLYSFVLLHMAYKTWLHRNNFRIWQPIAAGVLALGLLACSDKIKPFLELLSGNAMILSWKVPGNAAMNLETISMASAYVIYNVLFIIAYIAVLVYAAGKATGKYANQDAEETGQENRSKVSSIIIGSIMTVEIVMILINFGVAFPGTNVSNYPRGTQDAQEVIAYMHQRESGTLFYRAETAHSQTLNDGALNGYNGISTFTSSANVKVTEFMQALGYGAKNTYNRYCFEESSPVANLFLGLKYMIERDGKVKENTYFDTIYSAGDVSLLENNAYLPLGFLTNAQILNASFADETNRFIFQNQLMQAAAGTTQECWHLLTGNCLTIIGTDLTLNSQNQTGYCFYETGANSGTVAYRYTADQEGLFCFNVDQSARNNLSVYVNGADRPLYSESYSLPQMLSVCDVAAGDMVEIRFRCNGKTSGTINVSAAVLNEDVFRQCYNTLNASTLRLTEFSNTHIEGTIECDRSGVLYTSIPQNGNWTVTVDGRHVQTLLIGGAMVGLNLSEGAHTIVFHYQNKAFTLGCIVSGVSLLVFIGAYLAIYQPRFKRKKGKYEK